MENEHFKQYQKERKKEKALREGERETVTTVGGGGGVMESDI